MISFGPADGRAAATGAAAGVIGMGGDYLAHGLINTPLLPEQAGDLLLKVLPLPVFSALLHTFTVLARPLLLVGATLVLIAAYGVGSILAQRIAPRAAMPLLLGAVLVVGGAVAILGATPSESPTGLLLEMAILLAGIPIASTAMSAGVDVPDYDRERRRGLRTLLLGGVGLAILTIGFTDVRRILTALAMKEGDRAETEITPVQDFYTVSKNLGGDPQVDPASWRLTLPDRSLTYADLLALPVQELELTLECISNDIGGNLISNGRWRGPRVLDLLQTALSRQGPPTWVLMEAADGYTESLRFSELGPDHLLATHLNGEPLPTAHGFPARFIFPGHYGMKQPKWVTRIRFSSQDERGYWEQNGWNEQAIVKTMSRIDAPQDGGQFTAGTVRFAGIAFAGDRRISAVQISVDGGQTWRPTILDVEFSPYTWRFWSIQLPLGAGHNVVQVRAQDGTGALQTSNEAPTLPDGADGYHTIAIDVQ